MLVERSTKTPVNRQTEPKKMPTDTREKILHAAFDVLSREGYENTSIKQIAEEGGVAQGLVHYYFKSKQRLVMEVLQFVCQKVEPEFNADEAIDALAAMSLSAVYPADQSA